MSTEELDRPKVPTTEETQEALQKETPEPQPTPELSPRARAEKEIWTAANKRAVLEAAEPLPPTGDEKAAAPAAVPAEAATPEGEPAPQGEEAAPAPAAETPPEDPEVEIIVNGEKVKVKQSQIIEAGRRTLQKDTAADMKLEIASKLLREAESRAGKQPSAPADAQPPAQPAKVPEKSDAELAELIQYGTKEQAATAIAEMRRRDTGTDSQKALNELVSNLPSLVNAQLAYFTDARTVQSEFKDIFADPYLAPIFHMEERKAREAGDARPPLELWRDLGGNIRKHFKLPTPQAPSAAGPTRTDKLTLKAAIQPVPRAAAARVDPGESEKPLTPEQSRDRALEAMRKARGQDKGLRKY